ncbi:MAG: hypothetical protein ABW080_16875 [Candidatus Thiodiazotropha sp.]
MYYFRPLVLAICLLTGLSASADEVGTGSGSVAEIIDVGSYTYIRLKDQNRWIATTRLIIAAGDEVEYKGGMLMKNFYSKTLDRTFDSIIFVQRANRVGEGSVESYHSSMTGEDQSIDTRSTHPASIQAPLSGEISPLSGGMTIAEIIANASRLNDQNVALRAMVVKVSPNIMGKNWITLQDGTGIKPNNRLIVTSEEMVSPGELVTVSGTLRNNIDIGSGYKYKVLLEQANFTQKDKIPSQSESGDMSK